MAAPDPILIDRPLEPPPRSANLVINALLQPIMWPAWVFTAGNGLRDLENVEPLGAVMLALVYVVGFSLLYDAVGRRGLRSTMLLTALFTALTVIALCVAGLFVGTIFTDPPWRRSIRAVHWLSLAFIAMSLWSAVTFRRWLGRVHLWDRTRLDCHHCGYNLIGTLHDGKSTCPECGTAIDPGRRARYRQKSTPKKP